MMAAPAETELSLLQLDETRNEEEANAAPVNDAAAACEAPVKRGPRKAARLEKQTKVGV